MTDICVGFGMFPSNYWMKKRFVEVICRTNLQYVFTLFVQISPQKIRKELKYITKYINIYIS